MTVVEALLELVLERLDPVRSEITELPFVELTLATGKVTGEERSVVRFQRGVDAHVFTVDCDVSKTAYRRGDSSIRKESVCQTLKDVRRVLAVVVEGQPPHAVDVLALDILVEPDLDGRAGHTQRTDKTLLPDPHSLETLTVYGRRGHEVCVHEQRRGVGAALRQDAESPAFAAHRV